MTETRPTPGASPIRDCVGAALRFSREHWRLALMLAAVGAVAATLVTLVVSLQPALGLVGVIANSGAQAFIYAVLTATALAGAGAARRDWLKDGLRVWGAMAVIAFFLFIVVFVVSIPVTITLFVGPMAAYAPELEAAGANQAAVMAILTRFAEENPMPLLLTMLFFAALWLYLTSRLYLAAPASIEQKRILSFETWAWTKGASLRIIGARLLLLIPANIFAAALGFLVGRLVGLDPLAPDPNAGASYFIYTLASTFFRFALYFALEAGLSTALYWQLKPSAARTASG